MTNAAPFDLPDDPPPENDEEVDDLESEEDEDVPENGLRGEAPEKVKRKPKFRRRASAAVDENGKPVPRSAPRPVGSPPLGFDEANVAKHPDHKVSDKDYWPKQWGPLWLRILDWLPSQKIGEEQATADDVMIGVERVSGGGQTGGATLEPLEGSLVAGDENESGDRALQRVITDTYHVGVNRARATFRLRFYYRRGQKGGIATSDPFTLDDPKNIMASRAAREQNNGLPHEQVIVGPVTTLADGSPMPPGIPPELLIEIGRHRANEAARANGKPPVAVVPVAPPPVNVESQLEVARLQAQLQAERDKAAEREKHQREMEALQQQVRDLQAAKDREAQEARFKALEARLNAPPAQDADARLAAVMLQQLQALGLVQVGPDGKPQPVGAGTPYQAPAVPPAQQVLAAAQVLASQQKEGENARETLRKAFGFADPRTEIVEAPEEKPEPSFWEKHVAPIAKGIMAHPEGPLAALAFIADGSPLGGMAKQAADAIGAGRAAVSAAKPTGPAPTSGGAGWQKPPSA